MMRLSVAVLIAALVTGSLAACSSGNGVPQTPSVSADESLQRINVVPVELRSSSILAKIHSAARSDAEDAVTPGIYASELYPGLIYGYAGNDRSNRGPVCSVGGPIYATYDVAVDRKGDVLVTDREPNSSNINVFAGPGLCGSELGSISDPYGAIIDVASRDAQTGKIVVANHFDYSDPASISVCTLSGGCTVHLTHARMNQVEGVALARNGDCWASANTPPTLTYFAHCQSPGVTATGFQGHMPAGMDIDDNGNLVVLEGGVRHRWAYIYSGCNPGCVLVGGPFRLLGGPLYGHLDASSKRFVAADFSELDVYSYSTSGITYEYSISTGLGQDAWGAAFSPPSKE